jgi:hypothetical protein
MAGCRRPIRCGSSGGRLGRATGVRAAIVETLGRLTLDTEELVLDEIGNAWERLSRSAGRRLVVRP